MKKPIPYLLAAACSITLWGLSPGSIPGDTVKQLFVYLNEQKLNELSQEIDLDDPDKVFSLVFSSLHDHVDVYPTENYYYFSFHANGKEIWGNIRLPHETRDLGFLSFAYWEFDNFPQEMDDPNYFSNSKKMGPEDGVNILRIAPFEYQVEYEGKKVGFHLNQLEQKVPATIRIRKGERLLMRTCDESGLQFYLFFNNRTSDFFFVLDDEEKLLEEFITLDEDFLFGKRTQFVFYHDRENYRKILVGVSAENIKRNNYYDGPFDQLADNYIDKATGLKKCIGQAYPYAKGRVNDFGEFVDVHGNSADVRLAITPYYTYYEMDDLLYFIEESKNKAGDKLYSYLVYDYKKDVPK